MLLNKTPRAPFQTLQLERLAARGNYRPFVLNFVAEYRTISASCHKHGGVKLQMRVVSTIGDLQIASVRSDSRNPAPRQQQK